MKKRKRKRISETSFLFSTDANRKRLKEAIRQEKSGRVMTVPNLPDVPIFPNIPFVPDNETKMGQAGQVEWDGTK